MIIQAWHEVSEEPPSAELKGVHIRVVAGKKEGAPHFVMRVFELEPGSNTPRHCHDWEHEVFVLEGEGRVWSEKGEQPLSPGQAVFIPGGEEHQFRNSGRQPFRFICVIPAGK